MIARNYRERWFKDKDPYFRELKHSAFDPGGKYLALAGSFALLLVTAEDGHLDVVIRHRNTVFTALVWGSSGQAVCAFANGVIASVGVTEVHPSFVTAYHHLTLLSG